MSLSNKMRIFRLQIKNIVDEEMNAANQHMAFGVTSLVLVLMISPIIIFLVMYSMHIRLAGFYM